MTPDITVHTLTAALGSKRTGNPFFYLVSGRSRCNKNITEVTQEPHIERQGFAKLRNVLGEAKNARAFASQQRIRSD